MNKPVFLGVTTAAFLAGILIGAFIARRSTESDTPRKEPGAEPFSREPSKGSEGLHGTADLKDEIITLRRRIRELESKEATPSPADRSKEAAELYRDLSDPRLYQDAKRWLRTTGRLADLDPSMAPLFVRKYRERQPQGDGLALELAIGCGGPEVVSLLKDVFGNPATPAVQRHVAGVCMTGMGLVSQMWPEYSPDPALTELAGRYVGSSDPADRRGAIGLLRLQPGDSSRAQLQFIVSNDQDDMIRMAAVAALARVGDQSTRTFLHQYAARVAPKLFESGSDKDYTPLEYTLQHTLETLRRKFPE